MGQIASTTKSFYMFLATFLWGTAYLQTAFGNKTSNYKRLLVSQEVQFKICTIGTAFWGQAGMPTKV